MLFLDQSTTSENLVFQKRSQIMKLFEQSATGFNYVTNLIAQTIWRLFFVFCFSHFMLAGFIYLCLQLLQTGAIPNLNALVLPVMGIGLGWTFALIRQIHDFGNTKTTWKNSKEQVDESLKQMFGKED